MNKLNIKNVAILIAASVAGGLVFAALMGKMSDTLWASIMMLMILCAVNFIPRKTFKR